MQLSYIPFALQTLVASLLSIYLLYKWPVLFGAVKQNRLRRYLKIAAITCVFYAAFQPANYGWHKLYEGINAYTFYGGYLYMCVLAILTAIVLETVLSAHFVKQKKENVRSIISFCVIAIVPLLIEIVLSPILNLKGNQLVANLSFTFWAGCLGGTFYLFFTNYTNNYNLSLQQKELELAKLSRLHIQSQLEALESKINPHFLYNSLNALAGLSLEDGAKAGRMAAALSTLFRYNLNKEQTGFATVAKETEMTTTYLTIEKIRFEERLQFDIHTDAGCENLNVPRFILQPLVENCIKHGFSGNRSALTIHVSIQQQNNALKIEVADNGAPFKEQLQPGYGLRSIQQKLQLLYPQQHSMSFSNNPKKITIELYKYE